MKTSRILIALVLMVSLVGCGKKYEKITNCYIETVDFDVQQQMCIKKPICNRYLALVDDGVEVSTDSIPSFVSEQLGAVKLLDAKILPDSNLVDGLYKVRITNKEELRKFHVEVLVSKDSCNWNSVKNVGDFDKVANQNEVCKQIINKALTSIAN